MPCVSLASRREIAAFGRRFPYTHLNSSSVMGICMLALLAGAFSPAMAQEVVPTPAPVAAPMPTPVAVPPATPLSDVKAELAYRAGLGRADDVKLLLKQGADPNGVNESGVPLLLVAASRRDGEALGVVQALLEGGAQVNGKDSVGQTALYYAARNGNAEMVEYLLRAKIDYYSLDRNGDIARTIAFRAGHQNIVTMMDDFVKGQTLQIQNVGPNAERLMREQQEKQEKEAKARAEEQVRIEARINAENAEKQRILQRKRLEEYQQNMNKLQGKLYFISYNACAFEYWSFCMAMNQTTMLSEEELKETIEIHRRAVKEVGLEVMGMFDTSRDYVNQITTPSKQFVYNQLSAMPSRTYRKEHGVGTLEDVHDRCNKIAKNWKIMPPGTNKPKPPPPESLPAAKKPALKPKQPVTDHLQIQPVGPAAVQKAPGQN